MPSATPATPLQTSPRRADDRSVTGHDLRAQLPLATAQPAEGLPLARLLPAVGRSSSGLTSAPGTVALPYYHKRGIPSSTFPFCSLRHLPWLPTVIPHCTVWPSNSRIAQENIRTPATRCGVHTASNRLLRPRYFYTRSQVGCVGVLGWRPSGRPSTIASHSLAQRQFASIKLPLSQTGVESPGTPGVSPPWIGTRTCKNGSAKSRETGGGVSANAVACGHE